MALIKCSDCGKDVSDKAAACIHCGCPIEKARNSIECEKCGAIYSSDDECCPFCNHHTKEIAVLVEKTETLTTNTVDKAFKPKKMNKAISIIAVVFFTLCVAGGGAWLYYDNIYLVNEKYTDLYTNFSTTSPNASDIKNVDFIMERNKEYKDIILFASLIENLQKTQNNPEQRIHSKSKEICEKLIKNSNGLPTTNLEKVLIRETNCIDLLVAQTYYDYAVSELEQKGIKLNKLFSNSFTDKLNTDTDIKIKYATALHNFANGNFSGASKTLEEIPDYEQAPIVIEYIKKYLALQGIWGNDERWIVFDGFYVKYFVSPNTPYWDFWWESSYFFDDENLILNKADFMKLELSDNIITGEIIDATYNAYYKNASFKYTKITENTFYKLPEKTQVRKEPMIGMTKVEAENSSWGKPEKINETTTKYGTREQWVYSENRYLYFDDGILSGIQD